MPRVAQKAAVTLKSLALQSIAANMDRVWCREFLQRYYGTAHFRLVLGPFDCLPHGLVQDLWNFLRARRLLRKHHLFLIVSPYCRALDCSSLDSELLPLSLLLAGQRCSSLQHLSLQACKLPRSQLSETLPLLDRLTSLSLAQSTVTDSLLSVVGLYCPLLHHLDLSYCTQLSDLGLLSLFLQQDHHGQPSPGRFGVCFLLRSLLVAGTQGVTDGGAREALLSLPSLQVFDYTNTGAVLSRLCREGRLTQTSLTSLHCSPEEELDLAACVSACPRLAHLHLATQPGLSLLSLLDLEELVELKVCDESGQFCLPVSPLLGPVFLRHGATLVSLALAEVREVEVGLLAALCPALRHLALLWNQGYRGAGGQQQGAGCFPSLRTAEVTCREEGEEVQLPPDQLGLILSSPLLHRLSLSQCDSFTPSLTSATSLTSLSSLKLVQCHQVSLQDLHQLLLSTNPLQEASFLQCELVTLSDFQEYERQVKKWKWDVKLHWA